MDEQSGTAVRTERENVERQADGEVSEHGTLSQMFRLTGSGRSSQWGTFSCP